MHHNWSTGKITKPSQYAISQLVVFSITNRLFRFAFSHLSRCEQLSWQKHKKQLYMCKFFLRVRFPDSSKPSQFISLIHELTWLAGNPEIWGKLAKIFMSGCSCDQSCPHILMTSRSASARGRWCEVSCDILYYLWRHTEKTTAKCVMFVAFRVESTGLVGWLVGCFED